MTASIANLLTEPLLRTYPGDPTTLPGALARLARDEVDGFPALRPHQEPGWHMFLVQLAALALHRAERADFPDTEEDWRVLLRGLTADFPDDEPWCLVVADWTKPAFLQPPVPAGVTLPGDLSTPDELDLLITAKNHDLKQAVAVEASSEDWVYALMSLQTSDGYSGPKNYGVSRMNGGSSSRAMLGLAPVSPTSKFSLQARPGPWFHRDVTVMLATRDAEWERVRHLGYPDVSGLGLTWLAPWPEGSQLTLSMLDFWYIDVCRRVRLIDATARITARRGNSAAERIAAKQLNGMVGDPWAPVHKTEAKSLTLGGRSFDYTMIVDLLSGNWVSPLLARPDMAEANAGTMLLVAAALSRGNSKTEGFKSRVLPIGGKALRIFADEAARASLNTTAKAQMADIEHFDKAIRDGLALLAAGGDREKVRKEHYAHTNAARSQFDQTVDRIFFEHLWERMDASEVGEAALTAAEDAFALALYKRAERLFEAAVPGIPCPSLFRFRAEARARNRFRSSIRANFPKLFAARPEEVTDHVDP